MLTQDDIIYFVVTDRFANGDPHNDYDVDVHNPQAYHGGDFAGIVERIPYLQHLGVTALWITPVYENIHMAENGSWGYHGYWPLDFEKVDPHLYTAKPGIPPGNKRYLKDLVDQLHAAGIKVILDMVVNHTGYNHPGLTNDPSTPIQLHWFTPDRSLEEAGDVGGWLAGLPDLDQNNTEVADYFVNTIADWIEETGIDCIRMDTVKHVEDVFWHYYATVVKGKYPSVTMVGEVLHHDIEKVSGYQKNFPIDSLFDFPLQNSIWQVFIYGESFNLISSPYSRPQLPGTGTFDRDVIYNNHNLLVTLLDNHDLHARFFTLAIEQAGGDRGWALQTTKLALTLLLTSRGIPQLFYGTELALEGSLDPDNRRDMPWDLIGPGGLEPTEKNHEAHELYQHTHQLVQLRRSSQSLRYGSQITLHVQDRLYVYLREYRTEWMLIAIYLGDEDMQEPIVIDLADHSVIPPRLQKQMCDQQYVDIHRIVPSGRPENGRISFTMPKRSSAILMPLKQMLVSVK
jgi:glycosidase